MLEFPSDLRYSDEHEWVREGNDATARIGVTQFATDSMGDVVYASLPNVGDTITAGESCGELESTKSVSDLYAPVSGVVSAVNDTVNDSPEIINASPYDDGWLFEVKLSQRSEIDGLLDADGYANIATE